MNSVLEILRIGAGRGWVGLGFGWLAGLLGGWLVGWQADWLICRLAWLATRCLS